MQAFIGLPLSQRVKDDSVTDNKIVFHIPKKNLLPGNIPVLCFHAHWEELRLLLTNSILMHIVHIFKGDFLITTLGKNYIYFNMAAAGYNYILNQIVHR